MTEKSFTFLDALGRVDGKYIEEALPTGLCADGVSEQRRVAHSPLSGSVRKKLSVLLAAAVASIVLLTGLVSATLLKKPEEEPPRYEIGKIFVMEETLPFIDSFEEYRDSYFAKRNEKLSPRMPDTHYVWVDGERLEGDFNGFAGKDARYDGDGYYFTVNSETGKLTYFLRTEKPEPTGNDRKASYKLAEAIAESYIDTSACEKMSLIADDTIGMRYSKMVDEITVAPIFTVNLDRVTGRTVEIVDESSDYDEEKFLDYLVENEIDLDVIENEVYEYVELKYEENNIDAFIMFSANKKIVCFDEGDSGYVIQFDYDMAYEDGNKMMKFAYLI